MASDGVSNFSQFASTPAFQPVSPDAVSRTTTRDIGSVPPHLQESVHRLEEAAQNLFKNLAHLQETAQSLDTTRNITSAATPTQKSSLKALESRLHQVEKELESPKKLADTKERIDALDSAIKNLTETKPEGFETKIEALTKERAHLVQKQEQYQERASKVALGSHKESLEKLKSELGQEITAARKVESDLENAVSALEAKLDTTPRTSLQTCIYRLHELDKALACLQEYTSNPDDVAQITEQREKIARKIEYLRQISTLDPNERASAAITTSKQPSERFVELARKKFPQRDQSGKAVKNPVGLELLQTFVHGSKRRAQEFTPGQADSKLVKLGLGYQLERNDPLHRPWQIPPFSKYVDKWNQEVTKYTAQTQAWDAYDAAAQKTAPPTDPRPSPDSRPAPFFTWLEAQSADVMPAMYKGYDWGQFDVQQSHGIDIPLEGAGVVYYDQEKQQKAAITPGKRGVAMNAENAPATTVRARTEDSGPGYGTFAFGEDGRLLTGCHRPGAEYHSSLFAGEPIRAAGEIRIENGQILEITNKTGHYKTPRDQLISTLRDLKSQGYDLSQTTVRLARVIDNEKQGLTTHITIYDMYDAEALLQNTSAPPKGIHIRVGRPERATEQIVSDITTALKIVQSETNVASSNVRLHMFGEKDSAGVARFGAVAEKTTAVLTSLNIKTPIHVSALQLDRENETFSMSKPVPAASYLFKH